MNIKLEQFLIEAESNINNEVNLLKGAIVLGWTLLCLFIINRSNSFLYAVIFGTIYYLSLIALSILFFKNISKYLSFPKGNKKLPAFIGHKLDTVFTYPILLMAIIGIASNLLAATGLFPNAQQNYTPAGSTGWSIVGCMLLPLVAFAEELLNLLLVSFLYKYMRFPRNFRIIGSILSAAMIFGILHTFGWGTNAAISIGIAYIPVFFATLYTGNIWISFFAHFYNDLICYAKNYDSSYYLLIIAAISLIPAIWSVKSMLWKAR